MANLAFISMFLSACFMVGEERLSGRDIKAKRTPSSATIASTSSVSLILLLPNEVE
jgi:hypothetical protein